MKPVVLLIPGMLNTAAIWDRVTPLLHNAADVRIADVLTQPSIAAMALDAWAMLADVAPATPIVVCGFSMGGYVAIDMVAQPQRAIQGLVLLDTSSRPESPEGELARAKTVAAFERSFAKVVENMLPFSSHSDHHQDTALFDALRAVRRELAAAANLPPYVIFHDSTLRAMAASRPANMADMGRIPGVGARKLESYGAAFLAAVRKG